MAAFGDDNLGVKETDTFERVKIDARKISIEFMAQPEETKFQYVVSKYVTILKQNAPGAHPLEP